MTAKCESDALTWTENLSECGQVKLSHAAKNKYIKKKELKHLNASAH